MKRLHVHVYVKDLTESIAFYTALFGQAPGVTKPDYAKWLLDEPTVNFAISARHDEPGISHLGLQVDDEAELATIAGRLKAAGESTLDQSAAKCCYALSDKAWAADPQGIAWENFVTHGTLKEFGGDGAPEGAASASP